jgi:hypothetical protein
MNMRCFLTGVVFFCLIGFAHAEIINIGWGAPDELSIRVGAITGVTTVTHDVPITNIGDGTPISGEPTMVVIEASARRAARRDSNRVRFVVTADSSVPLRNGTDIIPFMDISWISSDGDIPSGRFDGTSDQEILSGTKARYMVIDRLTFSYDNTRYPPAGIYTGSVTYTVSIP